MSFADLRSARKSKELKSFAKATVDVKASQDLTSENEASFQHAVPDVEMAEAETSISPAAVTQIEDRLAVVSDIPITLPASIEVRRTEDRGRGLYAKQSFAPGNAADPRSIVVGKLMSRV